MTWPQYTYWLAPERAVELKKELKSRGYDVFEVRKAVCIPLSDQFEIALAPPETFSRYEFCRRQLSWYHQSSFAGKTLMISKHDLEFLGLRAETVISPGPDHPPGPTPAGPDDLEPLIAAPAYQRSKPAAWDDLEAEEPAKHRQWLKVMGLTDWQYQDLFEYHQANHANFIEPVYYAMELGQIVPYSIGPTSRVCSACLEFFNIVGRAFPVKLVVPCPGAVLFARLEAGRYYRVISPI